MKISQHEPGAVSTRRRERVLVNSDSPMLRRGGVVMFAGVLFALTVLTARHVVGDDRLPPGRFGWSVALLAAMALIARGVLLGRPVTAGHALAGGAVLGAGLFAHFLSYAPLGDVMVTGSGLALMWPTAARPEPGSLARVWPLVDATHTDALAPFAMHATKSYHFNADRSAAIAYRTRLGFAVVSGDPIGDSSEFADLAATFVRLCRSRGWQIIVLACGERWLPLWRKETVGQPMTAVPIGRDVVIDVRRFSLRGRRYRNVRQAVQRTHNVGVTTSFVDERDLDAALRAELTGVLYAAHRAARSERGFCMSLDRALQGCYPGVTLAIARDRDGQVVAFHRYASADHGAEVSLDLPFRRPGAPNGVDERLTVDMLDRARNAGARRLSLAFAAFPEIFEADQPSWWQRSAYRLIHLLDPLIRLESLYRYLRKFHSLAERRYVVLGVHHIPAALMVLLSLEFAPRRRHRPPS